MALGALTPLTPVPLAGLSARSTNYSAQCYVLDETPSRDVGYVTKEKRFSLFLWNGSAADVTLTAVSGNEAAEGITWDATPPDLIATKTSLRVNVTVGVDGPLEYEALISFVSACAYDPILTITGTRAPQLSTDVGYLFLPHNWADGLEETLAWKTNVLIAHNRTEQRIQLRTLPRRSWDLRLLVAGAARRKLETWLGMRKARQMFLPIWRDVAALSAPIAADDSTIPITDGSDNYVVGTPVAVWTGVDHFEIRTITGVGETYVSVDAPFNTDWPAGATMTGPCRYCFSMDQRRVSRFTEDTGDYRLIARAVNDQWQPSGATPATYRGLPVCPFTPSWEGGEETYDNKWVALDNDIGLIEYDIQSLEPVMSREARFLIVGRGEINTFLQFLNLLSGRLASFWLAATDRGLELAKAEDAEAPSITIEGIGYEYALLGSNARSHVELITTEGTIIRRMITAVETLPCGNELLTLDVGLPVAVSASTLNRCAWLELVRLDSDEITLHWVAWDCLQVTLPIVVLP